MAKKSAQKRKKLKNAENDGRAGRKKVKTDKKGRKNARKNNPEEKKDSLYRFNDEMNRQGYNLNDFIRGFSEIFIFTILKMLGNVDLGSRSKRPKRPEPFIVSNDTQYLYQTP